MPLLPAWAWWVASLGACVACAFLTLRSVQLAATFVTVVTVVAVHLWSRRAGLIALWITWLLMPFVRRLFGLSEGYEDADPLAAAPFLATALIGYIELRRSTLSGRAKLVLFCGAAGLSFGIPAGLIYDPRAAAFAILAYGGTLLAFAAGYREDSQAREHADGGAARGRAADRALRDPPGRRAAPRVGRRVAQGGRVRLGRHPGGGHAPRLRDAELARHARGRARPRGDRDADRPPVRPGAGRLAARPARRDRRHPRPQRLGRPRPRAHPARRPGARAHRAPRADRRGGGGGRRPVRRGRLADRLEHRRARRHAGRRGRRRLGAGAHRDAAGARAGGHPRADRRRARPGGRGQPPHIPGRAQGDRQRLPEPAAAVRPGRAAAARDGRRPRRRQRGAHHAPAPHAPAI